MCGAACDPADFRNFATRNRSANVTPASPTGNVPEGLASVSMPLTLGVGDAGLTPSHGGISSSTTVSIANWVWRLRADTRDGFDANDLDIRYRMGTNNTMVSATDSSSVVNVVVGTRFIDVIRPGARNTAFLGHINVFVDYTNATRAGVYNGTLNISVDCR